MDTGARIGITLTLAFGGLGLAYGGYSLETNHHLIAVMSYVVGGGCICAAITLTLMHSYVTSVSSPPGGTAPTLASIRRPSWPMMVLIVLMGLVLLVVWKDHYDRTHWPDEEIEPPDQRVFVPENKLSGILKPYSREGLTQQQADRMMSVYQKKWIRLTMHVNDVSKSLGSIEMPGFTNFFVSGFSDDGTFPVMMFDYAQKDRVSLLNKWDIITATCRIGPPIGALTITLDHCELGDVRPGPSPTPVPTKRK